ncbi:SatD family protein [Sanguibacter antarcticus]|uniref:SatD family protein n=1 Tax=Sanguibacter antarcticus TaxID=372484 RepID=A0A2A9E4E2_9MICO|nr:SatD family protein [Sanguibacter antarcticus]PFG33102.1 SatD family protein [Sanguibacter antarcticus]
MFVLTIDQQKSTTRGDLVPQLLERLALRTAQLPGVVLPFERTVGDEVQGVLDDPMSVLDLVLDVVRLGGWRTGLGLGGVHVPLPDHSREASGPAFVNARAAVERAKSRTTAVPVAVDGPDADRAADVEALLRLVGAIVERRTDLGWQVVDRLRLDPEVTQKEIARTLGISEQAVSQRVRSALWAEEQAAWPLAARLLGEADA